MTPIIASGLSVSLPRVGEVIRHVDLELRAGEVLGLLGPNGAGKSTLARAMAGLIPSSEGSVHLDGAPLGGLSRQEIARRIAYLAQEVPASLPFTAAEVVLMGRSPHLGILGVDGPADRQAAWAALDRLGATELAPRPLDALSGGERRRILLAKILAQAAPTWILDEPTAHLDLAHQHLAIRIAREHADDGGAVLCVLHDLAQAAEVCDRVAVLDQGKLIAQGRPAEVLQPALLTSVFRVPFVAVPHPETGVAHLLTSPRLRS